MTVVSSNGRPNRGSRRRRFGTGLVALVALSAGSGCGQSLLRPNRGPGLAAESLGLADVSIPTRKGGWIDPANDGIPEVALNPSAFPGAGGPVAAVVSNPRRMPGKKELIEAPKLTWNGWKVPSTRPAAVRALALDETTRAAFAVTGIALPHRRAGSPIATNPAEAASRETHIDLPRQRTASATSQPGSTSGNTLLEACRETRIAPPLNTASTSSPSHQPTTPPQAGMVENVVVSRPTRKSAVVEEPEVETVSAAAPIDVVSLPDDKPATPPTDSTSQSGAEPVAEASLPAVAPEPAPSPTIVASPPTQAEPSTPVVVERPFTRTPESASVSLPDLSTPDVAQPKVLVVSPTPETSSATPSDLPAADEKPDTETESVVAAPEPTPVPTSVAPVEVVTDTPASQPEPLSEPQPQPAPEPEPAVPGGVVGATPAKREEKENRPPAEAPKEVPLETLPPVEVVPEVAPPPTAIPAAPPIPDTLPGAPPLEDAQVPALNPSESPLSEVPMATESDPLKAACEATHIEPPRPIATASESPTIEPAIDAPVEIAPEILTSAPTTFEPTPGDVSEIAADPVLDAEQAASHKTGIPLPGSVDAVLEDVESELTRSSRETQIPLPVSVANPSVEIPADLVQASEETQIPLPVSVAKPSDENLNDLVQASEETQIPLPHAVSPGSDLPASDEALKKASEETQIPLPGSRPSQP